MKYFLLLVFLCGCVFTPPTDNSVKTSKNKQTRCWNDIDFKKTEEALLASPVLKKVPLGEYLKVKVNPKNPTVFLLFLKNGLRAVFKPNRTDKRVYSAVMSYRFSQFMGWKLVPPTVIRTIDGERGSVQLFIEADKFEPAKLTSVQKSNIFIYYFVSGDADPAAKSHILLGKMCGKPALIDNDAVFTHIIYTQYGDYSFLRVRIKNLKISQLSDRDYEKFPVERVQSINIKNLTFPQFKEIFFELSSEKLHYLWRWRSKDNAGNFYFVKWKNAYWIKQNFKTYSLVYKEFTPVVFSRRTISKLKSLDSNILNTLSPDFPVSKEFISGILYRRDVILKEARKLRFKSKHEHKHECI